MPIAHITRRMVLNMSVKNEELFFERSLLRKYTAL